MSHTTVTGRYADATAIGRRAGGLRGYGAQGDQPGPPAVAGGWSVLEVLLALSLALLVVAAAGGLVQTAIRAVLVHEGLLETNQAARRALERIVEEVRWAEGVVDDPACPPSNLCPARISVRIPPGNLYRPDETYDATFQHNATQREVERRVGAGVNNLAANVQAVTFTYFTGTGTVAVTPADVARVRIQLVVRTRDRPPLVIESDAMLRNRRRPALGVTPTPSPVWRPSPRGPDEPIPPGRITPTGPVQPSEPR